MSLKTEARSCVGLSVLCFPRQNKLCEQHRRLKGSLTDDDHRLEHLAKSGQRVSSIHGHPAELTPSLEKNLLAFTCMCLGD